MKAIILAKKIVGRYETLKYASDKFGWKNVVIGVSAFYGFWAWVLARILGKKFIYYAIDFYSPEIAFTRWDKIFIPCAMLMDRFLVKRADKLWNISERIDEGRAKFGHYSPVEAKVVPLCYPSHYLRSRSPVAKNWAIYVGLAPYGLELFQYIPEIEVIWLGKDKLLPLGELLDKISGGGFGISCWEDKGNNYYGDPGKTKLYSACGLPVIMTDNTPYAKIIKQTMAGIVIPYDFEMAKKAVKELLFNYSFYKRNVKETWKYINADDVFRNCGLLG